jgi:hypothetical protein
MMHDYQTKQHKGKEVFCIPAWEMRFVLFFFAGQQL